MPCLPSRAGSSRKARAAGCAFISARRPAWARPTPCWPRRASCRPKASTLLVGVIETHGRAETAALLEGLELLPLKDDRISRQDAARIRPRRARSHGIPALILIDELAHSNAPGSRHPKRWQDVEELLDAGIDVLTTVNVQHLESLNDVVGGITGIRVAETVPDTVFDSADEVVLVDLPADELLARLKSGKVYQAPQAERASKNFFRKGNLIALRELALAPHRRPHRGRRARLPGRTIDRRDLENRRRPAGAASARAPGCEHVVRSTARLAGQLGTEWHAIYVETPVAAAPAGWTARTHPQDPEAGARTWAPPPRCCRRATSRRHALDYAREHNLSKIALGARPPTWPWRTPHIQALAQHRARYRPDRNRRRRQPAAADPPRHSGRMRARRCTAGTGATGYAGGRRRQPRRRRW